MCLFVYCSTLQYTTVYYSTLHYTTLASASLHSLLHLHSPSPYPLLPSLIFFSPPPPHPLLPPLIFFSISLSSSPFTFSPPLSLIPPPSSPQSHCTAATGSVQRSQSETWDAPHDEQQALSSSHETSTLRGDLWVETETAARTLCWHCCWRHRF